jgi:hypothetical protein
VSAPAQTEPKAQPEAPEKKGKAPKAPKPPRAPKPKKPRQPWGIAPWLLIFALLLAGAAAAVLYVPIPGLTAKPATVPTPEEPKPKQPAGTGAQPAALGDLAQREADLAAREAALKQKEAEVARLLNELGVTDSESASLKRVAKLYTNMAPYQAAPLMAQLDDATAVAVLRLMTDEEAAAIIAHMDPDRGARIMRELTRPPVSNPAGG